MSQGKLSVLPRIKEETERKNHLIYLFDINLITNELH